MTNILKHPISKILFVFFAFCLTSHSLVFARTAYPSFASLSIIPSARECAMGGAGAISAVGPAAMYYNPALTSTLSSFAININYTKWLIDTYEQSIFLVRPLPYFNLGLGMVNFNYGDIEYRPDYPTENSNGSFNPNDFNFYLNLSKTINNDNFSTSFGISGRYYYQKIYEYTATGIGTDIGLAFNFLPELQVGFSIVNFGTAMRFIREDFLLPTKFLAGVNYSIDKFISMPKIRITSDFGYLFNDKKVSLNSGLEMSIKDKYFLRTGYKFGDQNSHVNFGFGVIVKNFRIEYAFSPYDMEIGTAHHFSLSLGY
jgi:hypothetical protein